MPSSFVASRNYSHCPLKKRPFALYNEPAVPEQDEPEDLSVKRARTSSPPPPEVRTVSIKPEEELTETSHQQPHSTTFLPNQQESKVYSEEFSRNSPNSFVYYGSTNPAPAPIKPEPVYYPKEPQSQEKLPSLAEYYLQLFKKTSEAEKKRETFHQNIPQWHQTTYLPPSPQNSPTGYQSAPSPVFNIRPTSMPSPLYSPSYPDTSALISPVSTCSSTTSESEEENVSRQGSLPSRYSCESCGKSYSTQSGLRKHNELHCVSLGPKAFSCKYCAKAYTSVGALKMHIRTHTLPCKCLVCGKAFSRPWLLQGHMRTHTGEKPFQCQQCHRSFADRSNLRAHQQTHERVKKYACRICKKTFSRMSLLNKHSETSCMGVKLIPSPQPHFLQL